jgi:hypothetical protein
MQADPMSDISIPRVAAGPGANPALSSFTHSYRARRNGSDTSTRRLFMAASALGLVLLAGMGVWTFGGHHAAGVPVIEADTRPLRIKPENAGGMTVVGANEQVMGGKGDGADLTGDLAPEAERPDPQALRAQRAVVSAPAAVAPTPVATPVITPPIVTPVVTPAVVTPAIVPGAAVITPTPAIVKPLATAPAPTTGSAMVQIAALETEADATTEWQRLAHKVPQLLGNRKPSVVKTERDGKTFWRLRTGGFADIAAATEFCRQIRAKGLGCSISS